MLIGQYSSRLTVKGRTALPAKFRHVIGQKAIIARWYEGCLIVVAIDAWKALLERLTAKAEFVTRPVRDTDRFILGSAYEIEFDSQGRFIIPKLLRDYAELGENLIYLGLSNRVEIWSQQGWQKHESEIQNKAEQMMENISKQERKVVRDK